MDSVENTGPFGGQPRQLRSAVTNGNRPFIREGADARSAWVRRWRDLTQMHTNDLGGEEYISTAQLSLCRRAATIEIKLEEIESEMSRIDVGLNKIDLYSRLSGQLRRILEGLGGPNFQRVARPVNDGSEVLATYFSRAPVAPLGRADK